MALSLSMGMPTRTRALSAVAKAVSNGLTALRKYGANAHLWLPGVGYFNGTDLGNYLDSAGTTGATPDNPIGLVLDQLYGGGTLGTNLVSNGDFSNGLTGWTVWQPTAGIVQAESGGVRIRTTDASFAAVQPAALLLTSGQAYQVTFTIKGWVAGRVQVSVDGTTPAYSSPTANGTYSFNVVASGSCVVQIKRYGGENCDLIIDDVVVQQVLGLQASQATTANKPVLRRGVINLLQYSGDLTNAAWAKTWVNTTATSMIPVVTSGIHRVQATAVSVVSGAAYTTAVRASLSGYRYLYLNGAASTNAGQATFDLQSGTVSAVSNGTATIAPVGDGTFVCAVSAVATASSAAPYIQVNNSGVSTDTTFSGDGVSGVNVFAEGTFSGQLTAAQILQCGGIPPTTSASASSTAGNWSWEGDGAAKYLATASVPFQLSDDFVLAAGAICTNGTPLNTVLSLASTSASNPVIEIGYTNGGIPRAVWRDDSGGLVQQATGGAAVGVPVVISAKKVGNNKYQRTNGVQQSLDTTALVNTTTTTVGIGARPGASWANFINGRVFLGVAVKGTVSDSDLLAIERFIAVFTGPYSGAVSF